MPTLFRMLMVLLVLGGAFVGLLVFLGSAGEPQSHMLTIDVPLQRSSPDNR